MVLIVGEALLTSCYDKVGIEGAEFLVSQIWRRVFAYEGKAQIEDLCPL
jgi:hypothetical protein